MGTRASGEENHKRESSEARQLEEKRDKAMKGCKPQGGESWYKSVCVRKS